MTIEWLKTLEVKEMKVRESRPNPTISPVAVEMWKTIIQQMFESHWDYKHVIIPIIEYTPNTDSDDGSISRYKTITVNYDNVEKTLKEYPIEDECEVALSRNIILIEKGKMAQFITLDIIDVDNKHTEDEVKSYSNNYYIVKTRNSFHLYPKNKPSVTLYNGGSAIKDKYWRQEYIRITDSEAKGALTKLNDNPQIP